MSIDLTTLNTALANLRTDAENGSKLYQDPPGTVTLRNGTVVDNLRRRLQEAGLAGRNYPTKAEMDADTATVRNTMACVTADSTPANNGWYYRSATPPTPGWTKIDDSIPGRQYIQAVNAGAGSANAIVATSSIPVPVSDGNVLVLLNITATTTATPVTVTINGGSARTLKTASGADIPPGGLIAGMLVLCQPSGGGTQLRIVSDIASSAIQTAAAASAAAAAASATSAQNSANSAALVTGAIPRLANRTALKAQSTATSPCIVLEAGRSGLWAWNAAVPVADHQCDPNEYLYAAPSAVATGAWQRIDAVDPRLAFGPRQTVIDIVPIYGQSNAKGTVHATLGAGAPPVITPLASMWDFATSKPVTLQPNMPTALDGTSVGNLSPALANEYCHMTGRRVIFVNVGRDSQSLTQLSKGNPAGNFAALVSAVSAVQTWIATNGYTVGRVSMVFLQGEQDVLDSLAGGLATMKSAWKTYYDKLVTLWTDIKTDTAITRFYMVVMGGRRTLANQPGNPSIQEAQREFCRRTVDAVNAFNDADKMFETEGWSDGLHFYQSGLNVIGANVGICMANDVLNSNAPSNREELRMKGALAVNPYQAHTWAGGGFTVQVGPPRFPLNFGAGLSVSNIIFSDETTDPNELRLYLPKPASQVLSAFGQVGTLGFGTGFQVAVGAVNKLEGDTDHFIPVRFYFSGSVRIDTTAQTIVGRTNSTTFNNAIASLFSTPIAAANPSWGTGSVTLRHPTHEALPRGVVSSSPLRLLRVNQSNVTTTAIVLQDTSLVAAQGIVDLSFERMQVPLAAVPTGLVFFVNAILNTYIV